MAETYYSNLRMHTDEGKNLYVPLVKKKWFDYSARDFLINCYNFRLLFALNLLSYEFFF